MSGAEVVTGSEDGADRQALMKKMQQSRTAATIRERGNLSSIAKPPPFLGVNLLGSQPSLKLHRALGLHRVEIALPDPGRGNRPPRPDDAGRRRGRGL
jgi:hypothetical protein